MPLRSGEVQFSDDPEISFDYLWRIIGAIRLRIAKHLQLSLKRSNQSLIASTQVASYTALLVLWVLNSAAPRLMLDESARYLQELNVENVNSSMCSSCTAQCNFVLATKHPPAKPSGSNDSWIYSSATNWKKLSLLTSTVLALVVGQVRF